MHEAQTRSVRPSRTTRAATARSEAVQPPKPIERCAHCNEAGYLELRQRESGELVVYRCPHSPKLIAVIEERLTASRLTS
jgi:hypothetical protein